MSQPLPPRRRDAENESISGVQPQTTEPSGAAPRDLGCSSSSRPLLSPSALPRSPPPCQAKGQGSSRKRWQSAQRARSSTESLHSTINNPPRQHNESEPPPAGATVLGCTRGLRGGGRASSRSGSDGVGGGGGQTTARGLECTLERMCARDKRDGGGASCRPPAVCISSLMFELETSDSRFL